MESATKRAFTLLEIVSRSTTNENEAVNAARQLGRIAASAGGFDKLFAVAPPATIRLPIQSFNESRRNGIVAEQERDEALKRVSVLEEQVSRLTVEKAGMKQEIIALKNAMKTTLTTKNPSGTLPFEEFARQADTVLGVKNWRQEFCQQTGIDLILLKRAANNGFASEDLVKLLPTLKNSRRAPFTPAEVNTLREWATDFGDPELAEKATEAFGRIITVSALRKLRTDLRGGNGWFGASAYNGPLPVVKRESTNRAGSDGRNASFPWSKYPELELMVCKNYLKRKRESAAAMARIVSEKTGMKVNEGQIKQRCDNAGPPASMLETVTGVGPLSWVELWKLGSDIRARAWKAKAFEILGEPPVQAGFSISHIAQNKIDRLRNEARLSR
jgi:hypothetical protein